MYYTKTTPLNHMQRYNPLHDASHKENQFEAVKLMTTRFCSQLLDVLNGMGAVSGLACKSSTCMVRVLLDSTGVVPNWISNPPGP